MTEVTAHVKGGEVLCLLGDNGAGKSTLIKIMAGALAPTTGRISIDDTPVVFTSPRDALRLGVATAYQDVGAIPLMSVGRNFVLGGEQDVTAGWVPFSHMDVAAAVSSTTLFRGERSDRHLHQLDLAAAHQEAPAGRHGDVHPVGKAGAEQVPVALQRRLQQQTGPGSSD